MEECPVLGSQRYNSIVELRSDPNVTTIESHSPRPPSRIVARLQMAITHPDGFHRLASEESHPYPRAIERKVLRLSSFLGYFDRENESTIVRP